MNFIGTRPLETERLLLRPETEADAEAMYAWTSDPEVARFMSWDPHPDPWFTREFLKNEILFRYADPRFCEWGIVWKETGNWSGPSGPPAGTPENPNPTSAIA